MIKNYGLWTIACQPYFMIANVGKMRGIKWFIYLSFVIILANNCTPKNYVGQYVHFWGETNYYDVLRLRKDSTFEYINGEYNDVQKGPYMPVMHSPPHAKGKGSYYIKKNKLYLDFGEDKVDNIFIDSFVNRDVGLEFEILGEYDTLSLPGAIVEIEKRLEKPALDGFMVDVDGKGEKILDESDFPVSLNIKYLGFSTESIVLEKAQYYKIKVIMYESPKPIKGQQVHEIGKNRDSIFINEMWKLR